MPRRRTHVPNVRPRSPWRAASDCGRLRAHRGCRNVSRAGAKVQNGRFILSAPTQTQNRNVETASSVECAMPHSMVATGFVLVQRVRWLCRLRTVHMEPDAVPAQITGTEAHEFGRSLGARSCGTLQIAHHAELRRHHHRVSSRLPERVSRAATRTATVSDGAVRSGWGARLRLRHRPVGVFHRHSGTHGALAATGSA